MCVSVPRGLFLPTWPEPISLACSRSAVSPLAWLLTGTDTGILFPCQGTPTPHPCSRARAPSSHSPLVEGFQTLASWSGPTVTASSTSCHSASHLCVVQCFSLVCNQTFSPRAFSSIFMFVWNTGLLFFIKVVSYRMPLFVSPLFPLGLQCVWIYLAILFFFFFF